MNISTVIITKNENKNLERCIESLNFCDQIIVIDDYSIDKTVSIAKSFGKVFVYQRKLNNDFAQQRNFGLSKASNDWVLFIDADEIVSKTLQQEIKKLKFDVDGYYIPRRDWFWGQEVKWGELRPIRKKGILRLVKKNCGQWLGNVHEVYHTTNNVKTLKNFIDHYPHPTIKDFLQSINYYSSIRSDELKRIGKKTNTVEIIMYPMCKFIQNYFLRWGFLDGVVGFVYAFMMSFHSFLVRSKLYTSDLK